MASDGVERRITQLCQKLKHNNSLRRCQDHLLPDMKAPLAVRTQILHSAIFRV